MPIPRRHFSPNETMGVRGVGEIRAKLRAHDGYPVWVNIQAPLLPQPGGQVVGPLGDGADPLVRVRGADHLVRFVDLRQAHVVSIIVASHGEKPAVETIYAP